MEALGLILTVIGVIGALVGGIWFLIVAFGESPLWGLGCMFVPLVSLIFLVKFWGQASKPFLLQLVAVVPMMAGMYLMDA
jgi:hypothetical protein